MLPFCAGVIVLKKEKDVWHTILVQTHKKHYGFPKGKREKGETTEENAFRELKEETGIDKKELIMVNDGHNLIYYDEIKNGKVSVRYFLGFYKKNIKDFVPTYDSKELYSVKWYKIMDVLKMDNRSIKKTRNNIMKLVFDNHLLNN